MFFKKEWLHQFYIADADTQRDGSLHSPYMKNCSWVKPKAAIECFSSSVHLSHLSIQGKSGIRDKQVEKRKSEWESSRGIAKNTPLA